MAKDFLFLRSILTWNNRFIAKEILENALSSVFEFKALYSID